MNPSARVRIGQASNYKCPRCALELLPGITCNMFLIESKEIYCIYCENKENKDYFILRCVAIEKARKELLQYKSIEEYRNTWNRHHHTIKVKTKLMPPDFVKDYSCSICNIKTERNHKICRVCQSQVKYKCQICNTEYFKGGRRLHEKTYKHKNNIQRKEKCQFSNSI